MSYSSRVYRQRNPKPQEESKEKPFFTKESKNKKGTKDNSFFQTKMEVNNTNDSHEKEADSMASKVVNESQTKPNVQRLATTHEEEIDSSNDQRMERDKEKPFQRKPADNDKEKEKAVQKKDDPQKEKDKEKIVQKKDDTTNDKEKEKIH